MDSDDHLCGGSVCRHVRVAVPLRSSDANPNEFDRRMENQVGTVVPIRGPFSAEITGLEKVCVQPRGSNVPASIMPWSNFTWVVDFDDLHLSFCLNRAANNL